MLGNKVREGSQVEILHEGSVRAVTGVVGLKKVGHACAATTMHATRAASQSKVDTSFSLALWL